MTFLRASLNSVLSSYTGLQGTYCSVVPDRATIAYLSTCCEVAQSMGFQATLPTDFHSTVVYSKATLSLLDLHHLWGRGFHESTKFQATEAKFTHWTGANSEGYVVLKLTSPMLTSFNKHLVDVYNLSGNFPDYQPHVTIASNAYEPPLYAEDLIQCLKELPMPPMMGFTGLKFSDIRD